MIPIASRSPAWPLTSTARMMTVSTCLRRTPQLTPSLHQPAMLAHGSNGDNQGYSALSKLDRTSLPNSSVPKGLSALGPLGLVRARYSTDRRTLPESEYGGQDENYYQHQSYNGCSVSNELSPDNSQVGRRVTGHR